MIIDAHLHIDLECSDPVNYLLSDMEQHSIDKGVLILNTSDEQRAFLSHSTSLFSKDTLKIAIGLNPHDNSCQTAMREFYKLGVETSIAKIHPRLMQITKSDFTDIEALLDKFDITTVIIDTLVYGPRYEYNCGIELGIYLAERAPTRKVVLAHAGSTRLLECMMMTRWLPNIYYDYSFICTYFISTSVKADMVNQLRITDERIIYGSDYPSFGLDKAKESFTGLCRDAGYTKEQMDKVMFRNASRVYFNA